MRDNRSTSRYAPLSFLLGISALLMGCAGSSASLVAGACPSPNSQSPDYLIGPGDMLQIFVWLEPELSTTVPVRPDGRVSTPLVEDMIAAGKGPSQLARDMEAVLGQFILNPTVSVIVNGQGQSNQIHVIGQVRAAASIPYRQGLRVLDAVVAAGGVGQFASTNRARITRQIDSDTVECGVRLGDILAGRTDDNILMFPGDVLVVPETRF